MFIARGMHQKHQSPGGATCPICLNHGFKADSAEDTDKQTEAVITRWGRIALAPEGRHVYSTRHAPNTLKPQRGDMSHLSESRIKSGFKAKQGRARSRI